MSDTEYEHFLYCPYCRAGQSMDDIQFETGIEYEIVCPKCLEEFSYETRLVFTAYKKKSNEEKAETDSLQAKVTEEMKNYAKRHSEDAIEASKLGILGDFEKDILLGGINKEYNLRKRIEQHKAKLKTE